MHSGTGRIIRSMMRPMSLYESNESNGKVSNLNTFGFIFENICIRDLSVYTSLYDGKISYYGDRNNLEVDCVIHLRDGSYALIDFKLGSSEEEKGAKNLIKLKEAIKEKGMREPSFLAIVNGGPVAYTRKDGIKVLPIGVLK